MTLAIGNLIFYNKGIAEVTLPSMLEIIGIYAFRSNSITSLTIPNSVTSIGRGAFTDNNLTSVSFEDNSKIVTIASFAFSNNGSLNPITLPTIINPDFTEYRDGAGNIYAEGNTISDFSINYYVYLPYTLTDNDVVVTNGLIESCSYDFSIKDIIIPDSLDGQTVLAIGSFTFYNRGITEVTLPSTLEIIAFEAFAYNSLTSVTFEANSKIVAIGSNAFNNNGSLNPITLPTHANPGFIEYRDGAGNLYAEGNTISDFSTNYYAYIPYTLTELGIVTLVNEL